MHAWTVDKKSARDLNLYHGCQFNAAAAAACCAKMMLTIGLLCRCMHCTHACNGYYTCDYFTLAPLVHASYVMRIVCEWSKGDNVVRRYAYDKMSVSCRQVVIFLSGPDTSDFRDNTS